MKAWWRIDRNRWRVGHWLLSIGGLALVVVSLAAPAVPTFATAGAVAFAGMYVLEHNWGYDEIDDDR